MTDGHVTCIRILDDKKIRPDYLAHYLRSVFGQTQMEKYTVGSTGQTELNDSDIGLIKILYPEKVSEQDAVVKSALAFEKSALKSREDYKSNLDKSKSEFLKALLS